MSKPTPTAPDTSSLDLKRADVMEQALALAKPTTDDQLIAADEFAAKIIKSLKAEIKEAWDANIKSAYELHKGLKAKRDQYLQPVLEAEEQIRAGVMVYRKERDKKIAEERRKREQAARDKAEREKKKTVAKLEKGGASEAEVKRAVRDAPAPEPVVMPSEDLKLKSFKKPQEVHDYRVVDEDRIPRIYMIPNHKAIRTVVRGMKDKTNIPGIEVFTKPVMARK